MELEKEGKLPFLDVLVTRKQDGTLGHAVYRKPTHTMRYLHAESHHHPAQKFGVLNTLINRAIHISDKESINQEKSTLFKSLERNGYKKSLINKSFQKQRNNIEHKKSQTLGTVEEENRKFVILPFVKGTSEKLGRIFKKHSIKTVFKPPSKIKDFLRPAKDKIPLSTPGVYEIPCSCGDVYIGETKRLISTRVKEHIRSTKNEDIEKSAVALHSHNTKHSIEFDKTRVIAKEPYYYPRIIRESIEIFKNKNNFNKEDSYRISGTWRPVLQKLKKRGNSGELG